MRTSRDLLLASKPFIRESKVRSWLETVVTVLGLFVFLTATFLNIPITAKIFCAFVCGLFYVRLFIIYHDYQHNAILQGSAFASLLMQAFGIFILAPQGIWKRSHDHHHTHNSKLTIHGIGSYPTISKTRFLSLKT